MILLYRKMIVLCRKMIVLCRNMIVLYRKMIVLYRKMEIILLRWNIKTIWVNGGWTLFMLTQEKVVVGAPDAVQYTSWFIGILGSRLKQTHKK